MKIKNTEHSKKIKNKNYGKRIIIMSGIIITTLLSAYIKNSKNEAREEINKIESTMDSEYNKYTSIYQNVVANLDDETFDSNFVALYNNPNIMLQIDEKKYNLDEVYLKKLEDGSYHLIKAGENKIDLLSNENLDIGISKGKLKDASFFYQMYQDGIFNSDNIIIDKVLFQQYIDSWDRKIHEEVPGLKAKVETDEIYQNKRR